MSGREVQKRESRARILESAGRGFRGRGYGGLGVDELARQAGVTSGAFYAHFKSKAAAFREAVAAGLEGLRSVTERLRQADPVGWRASFAHLYLGEFRRAPLPDACTLQSLASEVARADAGARAVFEAKIREVLTAMAGPDPAARAEAIVLLAILSGAVSMIRAVEDPALQEEIAAAAREAAVRPPPSPPARP